MKTMRFMTLLAAGCCLTATLADDVEFPNADGSGDLMSKAAWGGELPTGRPKITTAGDYVISTAGTLNGLKLAQPLNTTVKIVATNASGNVNVTMSGRLEMWGDDDKKDHRRILELVGGVYDFRNSDTAGWSLGSWSWGTRTEHVDVTFDGTVFTNLAALTMTHSTTGDIHWWLKNGASVDVTGAFKTATGDGAGNVIFDITGGSRFSIGSFDRCSGGAGNKFRVSGAGSTLTFGSEYGWVGNGENATVEVTDGAVANLYAPWGTLIGGLPSSHGCGLLASGSNSVLTAGLTYLGYGGDCTVSNQTIRALDGATVSLGEVQLSGGHDNGFIVSNATLTCGNMPYRWRNDHDEWQWWSTNYFIRIQGDTPRFSSSGALHLRQQFKFIFDLPPGGYRTGDAPLVNFDAWCCCQNNDQSADVIVNGLAAFAKGLRARGAARDRVRLIRYGGGLTSLNQSTVDRWNGYLQGVEGVKSARLFFKDGFLWLEVRVSTGLAVIVR